MNFLIGINSFRDTSMEWITNNFLIIIKWFLTVTSGTKPIIVSAGHV